MKELEPSAAASQDPPEAFEDFEEMVTRETAKDWLDETVVHDRLRFLLEMDDMFAGMDEVFTRLPKRIGPGGGMIGILDHAIFLKTAEHAKYGYNVLCRDHSDDLLRGRERCPICADKIAADDMRLFHRFLMPIQIHAVRGPDGWMRYKEPQVSGLSWMEGDEKLLARLAQCDYLDTAVQLERTAGWDWKIAPASGTHRWTDKDQCRLRRTLPQPGILMPGQKTMETALKVSNANWLHRPEPDRSEKILRSLPPGTVLVPTHWCSKKPKVCWSESWNDQSFADYGCERADRGNIACLMGPACIRSSDWDSMELFEEFLAVNKWARAAQHTFGRRGGNVWFRTKLPLEQQVCRDLERDGQHVGELRLGGGLTTSSGRHPNGQEYQVERLGALPFVALKDIVWPGGVDFHRTAHKEYHRKPGSLKLDPNKIENLHDCRDGTLEGRCPVCAERGTDTSCDNLKIWGNAYHCIRNCSTVEIFALAGLRGGKGGR